MVGTLGFDVVEVRSSVPQTPIYFEILFVVPVPTGPLGSKLLAFLRDKVWINKAAAANKKFIEYVTDPNKPQPKALPGAAAAADIIIDVAFKFWDRYQKAKKEERERLIRIIDKLKWPEFDSIKASYVG